MYGTGDTYRDTIIVTADDGTLAAATFGTGVLRIGGTDSGTTVTVTTIATGVYEVSVSASGMSSGGIGIVRVPVTRTSDSKASMWVSKPFRIGAVPTATNADNKTIATWGTDVVATLKRLDIVNDTSAPAVTVSNTSSGNGMSIISGTSGDGAGLFIQSRNSAGYGLYILAESEGVWIESTQSVGLEIHGGDQAIFLGYAENYPSPVEGAGIPCIQTAGSTNAGREFLRQESTDYAIVTGGTNLHADTRAQAIADAANNTVPAGETISLRAAVNAAATNVSTLLTNLATLAGRFTGITSLANWLRAMTRKSTPDATAASEIGGTYDATTDSLEAISEGVAAVDGGGDGTAPTAAENAEAVRLVLSGRDLVVRSGYANGTISIVRGAAYGTATNNQIDIPKATSSQYPTDLTGYTVVIAAERILDDVTSAGTTTASFSASVVNPSSTQTIRLQLAASDTTALAVGNWRWHARATKSGVASPIILCGGLLRIEEEIG